MLERLQRELEHVASVQGVTPADLLALPEPLPTLLSRALRRGSLHLDELSRQLHLSAEDGARLVKLLVEKGFLVAVRGQRDGKGAYRVRLAQTRGGRSSRRLLERVEVPAERLEVPASDPPAQGSS
jgi:DNA-binding MarR family transcriptional regulator